MPRGEFKKDENELGALWKRDGKKGPFYSGQIDLSSIDESVTTLDLECRVRWTGHLSGARTRKLRCSAS